MESRRRLLGAAIAVVSISLFAAFSLLRTPMTGADRAGWATQFADRRVYPDARLREMEETADPEMANLMKAEMARRKPER